jgi:uncharacterized protein (TIGR03437 family)
MSNLLNRASLGVLFLMSPIAAWADFTGTVTVPAGSGLNLATGAVSTGGGDLVYTGSQFQPQGAAKGLDAGNLGSFGFSLDDLSVLQSYTPGLENLPFAAVEGDLIVLLTNGGYYAKILVTAISSSSATLQYDTYGVNAAPAGPAISAVQNNYSYLQAGLPNYGIAPGSLFIIKGTDLASSTTAVLQTSGGTGIPTTLNGASISVTVNGVTTNPGIYYAIATQIAAVLPSATPAGMGTITVTYNGIASSAEPILVVPTALGFDTYFGSGTGLGVATDAILGTLFYYNASAKPGQTIVLWGSGLGADTADSDTVFTPTPHPVNVPLQIYIGGIQATIGYQGSSGYPGVNQINVTIPASVQVGCGVSIVAVSGNIVSNMVSLPVMPSGGTCLDPVINGTTQLPSMNTYPVGSLQISQQTGSGQTTSTAGAYFVSNSGPEATNGGGLDSIGSCEAKQSIIGATGLPAGNTATGLDAGTITVTGPSGTQPVPATPTEPGGYATPALPTGFVPASGGSFVFTGTGGKDVGPFTATVNYTNPIVWTNMNSITAVNRSQGVTLTWTGGDPNGVIEITGTSSSPETPSTPVLGAGFTCYAQVSAGQFTVPASVLLALPIGTGSLNLENPTTPVPFTAPGLIYAYSFAAFSTSIAPSYQ